MDLGAKEVSESLSLTVPSVWIVQEDYKKISLGQTGEPLKQRTPIVKYLCLIFSVVVGSVFSIHCHFDSVSCLVDGPIVICSDLG